MRKRIGVFISIVLIGLCLVACGSSEQANSNLPSYTKLEPTTTQANDFEKQTYEIYLLAQESGYKGTYEEWLESISGDEIELAVLNGNLVWKYKSEGVSSFRVLIKIADIVGPKGDTGNGISSIEKTNTDELIDTYTITYTDGNTSTFVVTNGKDGIQGIQGEKGNDGHSSVITIGENGNWYIDGEDTTKPSNIKGDTGNGISSIEKTNTDELIDTYTIIFTNGNKTTFTVTNGKDGIQGIQGEKGNDGHSPVIEIGENENWYIDGKDTTKPSNIKGDPGKSAFDIYCENHPDYNKTEKEWIDDLVNGRLADKEKIIVSFMVDDELIKAVTMESGTLLEKPIDPTKEGYTFEGWYIDDEKWKFNIYPVYNDLVLKARFTKNEYVLHINGVDLKYYYNDEVLLTKVENTLDTVYEGYVDRKDNFYEFESKYVVKSDETLSLKGHHKHISFNPNGGICEIQTLDVTTNQLTNALPIASKNDSIFKGWEYNGVLYKDSFNYSFDDDIELIAVYLSVNDLFDYDITESGVVIEKYLGEEVNVAIPEKIKNINVIKINSNFLGDEHKNIKSLIIPKTVDLIEEGILNGCSSLESITLPFVGDKRHNATDVNQYPFGYIFGTTNYEGGLGTEQHYIDVDNNSEKIATYYIPSTLKKVIITNCDIIPYGAFYNCDLITNIEVPDSLMFLYDKAFYNCTSLKDVFLSDGLTTIYSKTFYNCSSLTNVILPKSVTSIDGYAFYNCSSLKSIIIPEGVVNVGKHAFSGCSLLESIKIPSTIKFIGKNAFKDTDLLLNVYYDGTIKNWCDLVLQDSKSNPMNGNTMFYVMDENGNVDYFDNKYILLTDLVTPVNKSVIGLQFNNFTQLKSIVFQDSLTTLEDNAFSGCTSLTSVELPEGVKKIGNNTFLGCSSLTTVVIPDSVTTIGSYAFYECPIKKATMPCLGANVFKLLAFFQNNIEEIVLTSGESICDSAFLNCSFLTSIIIPEGVTSIGERAFQNCSSLTSITIPDSVTSIGNGAFKYCTSLTNAKISNNVANIREGLFFHCTALRSIIIPKSVTNIEEDAFYYCKSLVDVYNLSTINIAKGSTDNGYVGYCALQVHTSLEEKAVDLVSTNDGFVFAYTNGKGYLINYNGNETEITLPSSFLVDNQSITSYEIANIAFDSCRSLTSITIPENVTDIGDGTFHYCTSLTNIIIPDGVKRIGDNTFSGCTSLTTITIPNSVTCIDVEAFSGCKALKNIIIPDSVKNIGKNAFFECTSLTRIAIPDGVISIGADAFSGCSSLMSITIPNSVKSLGNFYGCFKLVEVYNLSQFNMIVGASNYGDIGNYSKVIHTSLDEESIITKDDNGYVFAYYDNKGYLIGYEGNETELTLPNSFIYDGNVIDSYEINQYAFYDCRSLTSVEIPDSVTSLGRGVFSGCPLLNYNEYDNGYYLGNKNNMYLVLIKAKNTNISEIEINDNCKIIYLEAFYSCKSLKSIIIPNSVTAIHYSTFKDCSIEKATMPCDAIKAVSNEFIKEVVLTTGESIVENAFYACGFLASITIPDSVTSIGSLAFFGCTSLTSITIPECVTSIGNGAFDHCNKLVDIYNLSTLNISKGATDNGNIGYCALQIHTSLDEAPASIIYTTDGYVFTYVNDRGYLIGYEGNETELTLPDSFIYDNEVISTYEITPYALSMLNNYPGIDSIVISESVISIDDNAFESSWCSLINISYNGNIEKWNSIIKGSCWNNHVPATKVICSDGEVAI